MKLSELRKGGADIPALKELLADIEAALRERFTEGWDAAKEESRLLAQRPEQGWGAPATEQRQALTARLRALEDDVFDRLNAQQHRIGEHHKRIEELDAKVTLNQDKRLAALESYVQDNPEPFPPSTKYGVLVERIATLENALGASVARVRDIERGVTSPAQLVPDLLGRLHELEARADSRDRTCSQRSD